MATLLLLVSPDSDGRLRDVVVSMDLDERALMRDIALLGETWQALGLGSQHLSHQGLNHHELNNNDLTIGPESAVPTPADESAQVDLESATGNHQLTQEASPERAGEAELAATLRALEPDGDYPALMRQIRHLLQLAAADWPSLTLEQPLRPGDTFFEMQTLITMLQALAEASSDPLSDGQAITETGYYDGALVEAVKAFQRRHGLSQDGVIGPKTLKWLNMTPKARATLLARGYVKKTRESRALPESYVLVNIPGFSLALVDRGNTVLSSRVIVGKLSRKTPLLESEISAVVVNPSWRVPRRLVKQDVLPKVARDGSYLAHKGFIVTDYDGVEVHETPAFFQQAALGAFPYRLEQRPGDHNSLGRFKLHFANDDSIYLHDTPEKHLYGRANRALSSGCVRVEKIAELADWFARNRVTDARRWQQTLAEPHTTRWFSMKQTMPVRFVYWTSWIDSEGRAQYRDDIYGLL
ncbi:L,D-transpeptidase family protein [Shewanella sp. JM162201]|uniref:L,D-transpeptidase family protein n=1 Tax=Shewanella jiangmenensis TaxID=2837387 RepID=A0ABS5V603_9GAMM|nr:L,D-transpeptidase family protein [Shewanella jiangmenensis]MBT1445884.1 L,D-transpeptidase family protein [Shewanella jiangmenensis]